jgi:hypothetical protein
MPSLNSDFNLINAVRASKMKPSDLSKMAAESGYNLSLSDISQFLSGWARPTDEQEKVINHALQRWHVRNQPQPGARDADAHREREMRRQLPQTLRELHDKHGYSYEQIGQMIMGVSGEAIGPILEKASMGEGIPQEFVDRFWAGYRAWSAKQEWK